MKVFLFFALSSLCGVVHGQSLEMVEKGASAVIGAPHSKMSADQEESFILFTGFIRGFLHGVASSAVARDGDRVKPVSVPEPWMWNPIKAASSFQAFISKNKPDGFTDELGKELELGCLMMGWYLSEHKDSSREDKATGKLFTVMYFTTAKERKAAGKE